MINFSKGNLTETNQKSGWRQTPHREKYLEHNCQALLQLSQGCEQREKEAERMILWESQVAWTCKAVSSSSVGHTIRASAKTVDWRKHRKPAGPRAMQHVVKFHVHIGPTQQLQNLKNLCLGVWVYLHLSTSHVWLHAFVILSLGGWEKCLVSLKPGWATQQVLGYPGPHRVVSRKGYALGWKVDRNGTQMFMILLIVGNGQRESTVPPRRTEQYWTLQWNFKHLELDVQKSRHLGGIFPILHITYTRVQTYT